MVSREIWRRELPFNSRWLSVSSLPTADNKLHYLDEGSGEVVLCLHGNPTWGFFYRKVIATLRQSYRVMAYDHFGCGLSSRPSAFGYTLADHIKVCEEFADTHQIDKVHLVVHDWGGAIGLGWAGRHPERVKSLTILNTAVFMEDDVPKRIGFLTAPVLGEFLMRRLNVFALAATRMASARGLSPAARAGLLYPYQTYEQRLGIARFVADIPKNAKHPTYPVLKEVEKRLALLTCPKQLVWGMKDFCFHPGFLRRWQTIYPEARVTELPQAGHYLLEDEPELAVRAIQEFLDGLP